MRNRFFWIIFFVLLLSISSTVILYQFVIRQERMALIDREIRNIATILINSDLVSLRTFDFDRVEKIISEELGEDRIGKFFVIRNNAGEVIYQSVGAQLLDVDELTVDNENLWTTFKTKGGQHIRILYLQLPSVHDRKLQVGFVIDDNILNAGDLVSIDKLLFILFIFMVGITVSWLLTTKLLEPISVFSKYVDQLAENKDGKLELPPLPVSISKLTGTQQNRDDFKRLVASFDKLISRVNRGYKLSRFWSYQMAHELKTPMAVIEAIVSNAIRNNKVDKDVADNIITEVLEVSETISSFLNWAEVENTLQPQSAHVTKLARTLRNVIDRLNLKYNNRVILEIRSDFPVYANQQQLELMCTNLISNACKYSSSEQPVTVEVDDQKMRIIDHGSPISPAILERLGEPFNISVDTHKKGSGLGLAYVQSVCRMYKWTLSIQPSENGNTVVVQFSNLDHEIDSESKTETLGI